MNNRTDAQSVPPILAELVQLPRRLGVHFSRALNASLDHVFYDVGALSPEERRDLSAYANPEGSILTVHPRCARNAARDAWARIFDVWKLKDHVRDVRSHEEMKEHFAAAGIESGRFIGSAGGFGMMNSRLRVNRVSVPNAWHSLNTALPGHLSVREVLQLAGVSGWNRSERPRSPLREQHENPEHEFTTVPAAVAGRDPNLIGGN